MLPLALGVTTLSTDKAVYGVSSTVGISGTCSADAEVGLQLLLGGQNVWFDQVSTSTQKFSTSYNIFQKGTYTLYAACQGDTSVSKTFCVGGDAECGLSASGTNGGATGGSTGGGSGGGGGAICKESWTCSSWTTCNKGEQTRTCTDLKKCKTTKSQPALKQSCTVKKTTKGSLLPTTQDSFVPTPKRAVGFDEPQSFLEEWMGWIIGSSSSLIIVIIVLIIVIVLNKHHHLVHDHNDIKDWVVQERAAGTSEEDIHHIITQETELHPDHVKDLVAQVPGGPVQEQFISQ